MLSQHAKTRCQHRGILSIFLEDILNNADMDHPIGDNCRLLRVSRDRARKLNRNDRLGRYAVIWSDDTSRIVTVLPLYESSRGARFRRAR